MIDNICGWAFPFRVLNDGGIAQCCGSSKLRQNIIHIVLTSTGERVMRRSYGGGVRQLLHNPNDDVLRAVVQHQITKAIEQSEPRVRIESVTIRQQEKEGLLLIDLLYTVRQTQQLGMVATSLDLRSV